MKDKKKIYPFDEQLNFIRLIDESMSDNLEEIQKELEEEGIDITEIQKNLLEMVKEFKAKLLKQQGKLFKEEYLKNTEKLSEIQVSGEPAFAFRKDQNEDIGDAVTNEELKKFNLIKKSTTKIFGKSNEQSNNDSQPTDR